MKAKLNNPIDLWRGAPMFSAKGLAIRAGILTVVFAVCHVAGLREYTTFLSGTSLTASADWSALLGLAYLAAYFGFILGTPILLIASAILAIWQKVSSAGK